MSSVRCNKFQPGARDVSLSLYAWLFLCTPLFLCAFAPVGSSNSSGSLQLSPPPQSQANLVCQCDPHDPFDPRQEALISQGVFKNQCLFSCQKRSVRFFDKNLFAPAQVSNDDNYWVANVVHKGSFWVASIPKKIPMSVIFQFEYKAYKFANTNFPGGHSELRFHFNSNAIRLYKQNLDGTPSEFISDIVFTNEPAMPVGLQLDLSKSIRANYPILYEIYSLRDVASDIVLNKHHHIEQYNLVLNDFQKDLALKTAIQMGTRFGMHTFYQLYFRNCATETFQVLNVAQNYDSLGNVTYGWDKRFYDQLFSGHIWGSVKEAVADFLARYPNSAWTTLRFRGLVDDDSRLMDLEREVKTAPWVQ